MGITINDNPVGPKVSRVLSVVLKKRGKRVTRLASHRAQRLLDMTGDRSVDLADYRSLKGTIKERWFTPAFFRRCIEYVKAVPRGAVEIESLGRKAGGSKLFYVDLRHAHRKNFSVRIEMMKSGRLKLNFVQVTWPGSNPIPIDYKPLYLKASYLEIDGFRFKKVRNKMTLPAGVHERLNDLALRAEAKRPRRLKRRGP